MLKKKENDKQQETWIAIMDLSKLRQLSSKLCLI